MSYLQKLFYFCLGLGLLLFAAVVGYWFISSSPVRAVKSAIRAKSNLQAEAVVQLAPGKFQVKQLTYRGKDGATAFARFAEIDLDSAGKLSAIRLNGIEISQWDSLLSMLSNLRLGQTFPPELTLDGVWRNGEKNADCPFQLKWKPDKAGKTRILLHSFNPKFEISGQVDFAAKMANLKFAGQMTPRKLPFFGDWIPDEFLSAESIEAKGEIQLDGNFSEVIRHFAGELKLSETLAISSGIWRFSPGSRIEFRWDGADSSWEVELPETNLVRPLGLPLGKVSVSGRKSDQEIRFSIVNAPPVGELSGVMKLDGRYNRRNGEWMFRQSENSDRAVRWSGVLPLGDFNCAWRDLKVSGGGTHSRGSIDFSLGFESLRYRTPNNPRELTTSPGTLSGSWSFNYDASAVVSFELNGLLQSDKLDWNDPESAWSATSALTRFRLSRQAGEKSVLLVLNPAFKGVNLYGGGVPKLKMEGVSGNLNTTLELASQTPVPLRIEGAVEIQQLNPVRSMFGEGEFKNLRLFGFSEFASDWSVLLLKLSGGAERAIFRYPQSEIVTVSPEFDVDFNRNSPNPGDNFAIKMTSQHLTLAALGGTLDVSKGHALWSGELRETGFLPDRWRATLDLPEGDIENRDFAGKFHKFRCQTSFERMQIIDFNATLDELKAQINGASPQKLYAKQQTLSIKRDQTEEVSGVYTLRGGEILEQKWGGRAISVDLPLKWGKDNTKGDGTFQIGELTLPGKVLRTASGSIRLDQGRFHFNGVAASEFWAKDAFSFTGEFLWGKTWEFTTQYKLSSTKMNTPLVLSEVLPALSGMSYSGELSGHGLFELFPTRRNWSGEFKLNNGTLKKAGFEAKQLSGSIRLPGSMANLNPGGELRFGEIYVAGVGLRNGMLNFRLPHSKQCDIISANGNIWGGRARLISPFSLRSGNSAAEIGMMIRGVKWNELFKSLDLQSGLLEGTADGMLFWRFRADDSCLDLVSAELTSVVGENLKLAALEPFVLANAKSSSRQRIYLELLRDFNCRILRVRLEEEPSGSVLLELSAAGKPSGSIKVKDENYRKLINSIDPAAFGLDGEIEIFTSYRIPAKSGKTKK
ncbi:MAG: hypothetical protein LBM70_08580 [Victivallales bacterium]|jgi:hypothetical protein|nr:hypothetical protein [Victivallales bacterium]